MHSLRPPVIAAVFVVTLLAFIGGFRLFQIYGVQTPVEQRIAATGLVDHVEWVERGKELKIYMKPAPDLRQAYEELEKAAGDSVSFSLSDNSSASLDLLYQTIEPTIYEAAVRGNFTFMADRVNEVVSTAGLDAYAVQVDEKRIYLSFHKGDDFLYRVIPRNTAVMQEA